MSQREEKANTDRLPSALQQLARRVVDGRDVVRVERVAETQGIGDTTEPNEPRVAGPEFEQQSPPREMQQPHRTEEPRQALALPTVERLAEQLPHRGHRKSLRLIATE